MEGSVFCSRPACWAPGLESPGDWLNWADGGKAIEKSGGNPTLEFTSPLFRRRLSQLSRMTVRVVHDALEMTGCGDIKQSFISLRGEITRQLSMEKALITEETVLPAVRAVDRGHFLRHGVMRTFDPVQLEHFAQFIHPSAVVFQKIVVRMGDNDYAAGLFDRGNHLIVFRVVRQIRETLTQGIVLILIGT